MTDSTLAPVAGVCPACGTEIAPRLLSCPKCRRLVHADELKRLAGEAKEAQGSGDVSGALTTWRRALELLPRGSNQFQTIAAEVDALSRQLDGMGQKPSAGTVGAASTPPAPGRAGTEVSTSATPSSLGPTARTNPSSSRGAPKVPAKSALPARLAALGFVGLLIWKFKFVVVFLLTQGKFLLLGLTKGGTILSAFAFFGVYWAEHGWKFAAGIVVSIYIHEMGHVAALRRYGIPATAPMFIPGLGALIRMKGVHLSLREESRVGLAGPIWGLCTALAAAAIYAATGARIWAVIAGVGAWINLFNLIPFRPLDGGRGFQSFTQRQRWIAAVVIGSMFYFTREGMLAILLIGAVVQAFRPAPSEPDENGLLQYVLLVVSLTWLCALKAIPGATI